MNPILNAGVNLYWMELLIPKFNEELEAGI